MSNKLNLIIFIFRLGFGINFFLHGLTKILGDQEAFKNYILTKFSETLLPSFLIEPYAIAIPYIELLLGFLLIIGLFYYWSLLLSMLTMISLMIGMILIKDWSTVSMHLVYLIYLFLLGVNIDNDKISIDYFFNKKGS
jgi:thiosulfate dehydrogenase (quinone) large subunit